MDECSVSRVQFLKKEAIQMIEQMARISERWFVGSTGILIQKAPLTGMVDIRITLGPLGLHMTILRRVYTSYVSETDLSTSQSLF